MIVCPVCSFRNPDANDRCFKCSALLVQNDAAMQEAKSRVARRLRSRLVLQPLAAPIDWLRHRPWVNKVFASPDHGRHRYPYTAGLFSLLVPGAGHWYVAQGLKGTLIFVVALAFTAFAIATIREAWSNVVLFLLLLFWLLVWADSVASAAVANGERWVFRKTLALLFGAMMIIGVSVSVLQYLGLGFVKLERLTSNAMVPAFHSGDRVLFTSVPLWFRSPRMGEMVSFDPPRFVATEQKNVYSINISRYFQRVAGLPGDRVAKEGATFFLNGEELAQEQEPLGGELLPDFDVVVPEGSYFLPVTGIPQDLFAGVSGAGYIGYVGQTGLTFENWPGFALVPEKDIAGKGIAIVSPPENRRWLK